MTTSDEIGSNVNLDNTEAINQDIDTTVHPFGSVVWQLPSRLTTAARLNVNLLPKLSKLTREHFRAEGITTLTQVAAMTPAELRRFKGIKTTAEGIRAHAEALINKTPVWFGSLPDHVATGGWMFDIETIMPDNKEVWSIGWSGTNGVVKTIVVNSEVSLLDRDPYPALSLPGGQTVIVVPNAATAWRVFADAVADARPIFHWSPFDNGVMKNHAPEDVRIRLAGRLFDLCYLFDRFVKCPIYSLSLKTVAPFVDPDFGWDERGDAFTAYLDYSQWLRTRDLEALASAHRYQVDDVRALYLVWEWLREHRLAYSDKKPAE